MEVFVVRNNEVFVVRINLESGKTGIIHDGFLYELVDGNKLVNPVEVLDINDFKDTDNVIVRATVTDNVINFL